MVVFNWKVMDVNATVIEDTDTTKTPFDPVVSDETYFVTVEFDDEGLTFAELENVVVPDSLVFCV